MLQPKHRCYNQNIDVTAKNIDVTEKNIDVTAKNIDATAKNIDVTAKNIDVTRNSLSPMAVGVPKSASTCRLFLRKRRFPKSLVAIGF